MCVETLQFDEDSFPGIRAAIVFSLSKVFDCPPEIGLYFTIAAGRLGIFLKPTSVYKELESL